MVHSLSYADTLTPMGRQRKTDRHLPPCIYLKHGAYYLVRGGRWERLGTDLSSVLAEYGKRFDAPQGSMSSLIETVLANIKPRIAKSTHAQYNVAAKKLKTILKEFSPEQVKPKHVAQIKLALASTPNMANRVLSFLRQVFDYALENQLVESNPAVGIKRHKESKRGRLLSEAEFLAIRAASGDRLQAILDLLYATGQRVGDVLRINRADLLDAGVAFTQQKTGARLIVAWSPKLRVAVERAKTLGGNVRALTLLYNRRGKAPDYRTIKLQWDAACKAAGVEDAHLHDIRAMSLTAVKKQRGKAAAREAAGHTNDAQTERYFRDREIPLVYGPN